MQKKYIILLLLIALGASARTISDLVLKIGDGTDNNVTVEFELGKGANNPKIQYNTTTDKTEVCNEGVDCFEIGTGEGGGGIPLLSKGSLVTSDGTDNGEFAACADGETIVWDSAETNGFKCVTKATVPKYITRFSTVGAGTWTRSSDNVKKVVFYYCGGGAAGGGVSATTAAQVKAGRGGFAANLYKCTIDNPSATISYSIGDGGIASTGVGSLGGNTVITGCTTAPRADLVPTEITATSGGWNKYGVTNFSYFYIGANFDNGYWSSSNGNLEELIIDYNGDYAYGGRGGFINPVIPELRSVGSFPQRNNTGRDAVSGSCGGGSGASAQKNTAARVGGNGGSGQIVSYEFE